MPLAAEEVVQSTRLDKVNISVYGNPVLDVIANVREGSAHVSDRAAISQVATIRRSGNLEFRPDTYVGFHLQGAPIVWGPFNPNGNTDNYSVGNKFEIPIHVGERAQALRNNATVSMLPGPHMHIGGGGANVLFGFYDVFAQLRVELLATIEKNTPEGDGRLDQFIKPLIDKVGDYTQIPLYDWPGINLVIEGLGPNRDRTIFIAQLPRDGEDVLEDIPRPLGRAVMVNSLHSPQVAIDALAHVCSSDRLGFLALTKSLCNKSTVPEDVFESVLAHHPSLKLEIAHTFKSIHQFVTEFVLPRSNCVCIVNESELEHLTDIQVGVDRGESYLPTLGGVVDALKEFRRFQGGRKQRIYTTLGAAGSVVLDERNHVIYCDIVDDASRIPQTKTAIGDTYATFVLALETIGNYTREHIIPAQDVLRAAAGGADSGVYDGFGNLAVNKVNNYLGDVRRRLVSLGPLETIPSDKWMDRGISEMRNSDWDLLIHVDYLNNYRGFVPTTLQEVIGRAYLKLPGDDHDYDRAAVVRPQRKREGTQSSTL